MATRRDTTDDPEVWLLPTSKDKRLEMEGLPVAQTSHENLDLHFPLPPLQLFVQRDLPPRSNV